MQHLALTSVDYVTLGVILISALYAMTRGLVQETFTILGWLVAGFAALRLSPILLPLTQPYIAIRWLQWAAVGAGTFLLVYIPLSIATGRLSRRVRQSPIGAADRAMGFVFGAGRGLVIVSLAYLAFAALVPERDHPDVLVKARFYPVIRETGQILQALMPGQHSKKEGKTASSTGFAIMGAQWPGGGYGVAETPGVET
jgi:membrane protein required for colicin V production